MRSRSLILSLIVLILISIGCSRDSFAIHSTTLLPSIVATHSASVNSTIAEGLAIAISADPLTKDEIYQLSITSPSATFVWEPLVTPFLAADRWFIGSSDLLLPPDTALEVGTYEVEIFLPDGRRFVQQVTYDRTRRTLQEASLFVASLAPVTWEYVNNRWRLSGYAEDEDQPWRYTFYDANHKVLYTQESASAYLENQALDDGKIKELTTSIIASRFNDNQTMLFVVRTFFT